MIMKNTPSNLALVRKLCKAVNSEVGFRAIVDRDWNCGEEIRFEIGVLQGTHFLVITNFTLDSGFQMTIRMREKELAMADVLELKDRLESVDKINSRLEGLLKGE